VLERRLITRHELARRLNVRPQTLATWERRNWIPQPIERISDRVLIYDFDAVEAALATRAAAPKPIPFSSTSRFNHLRRDQS
jgi:transcriptional regulator with XRE-family HTH domain